MFNEIVEWIFPKTLTTEKFRQVVIQHSTVCSVNGCCGRPEEYLERMVDSVLEALCETNPTKLCTLLQMERDEAMLSRVLSSHKVQWFMQQVCGRDMRCGKSQPMRGAKSVPELLRLERAQQLTAERQLSPEDMLKVSQKLRNAGFRIDLLEDIENIIDVLWHAELANRKSESDLTSDVESRKWTPSVTSYSTSDSLSTQLPPECAKLATAKKISCNLEQKARQQRVWQQQEQHEQQQTPSLLSRLSAVMSTHSDDLHQKVKADVSHAEAISSGETTGTFLQRAGSATHQGAPITYSY
ncbi:uncharacterized protein LOC126457338 [Schistocerca serialis cubense]|uniref:uncharacterized protein LOC126457338 n=1 Tax=Schistocerca serialis cubense TaxID=2023355 RepID=UPI00214E6D7F|nr:uncharacterized protein LOC126457338 [Schistocerca serialis cubense]